jgi:hypothetical protein
LVGVQQLRYHEFLELGRVANRTLNQRHAIANGVSVRRAADALETCASLPQFCEILSECLEPIGFDGFGLYFSSGLPFGVDFGPLTPVGRTKIQYFWVQSPAPSDTNWSLTISLLKRSGRQLGGFTLYRKNTTSPLWMDLDVFTTTGFSAAVAACVEKMQKSWLDKMKKDPGQKPSRELAGTVIASRLRQSIPVRSSG